MGQLSLQPEEIDSNIDDISKYFTVLWLTLLGLN